MKKLFIFFILIAFGAILPADPASALGLKVTPLEYRTTLQRNEKKKAFIDVSNPSGQTIDVTTSVQAFRQINNEGALQFYDDPVIEAGIQTDLESFQLGSREAVRMFIQVDGQKLPEGDVFAAVFFTTAPTQPKNGIGQLVRVGTLLSIVNHTPGERKAKVSGLTAPFWQMSDEVNGSYNIKNIGQSKSGFYPEVTLSTWPSGKQHKLVGSLVFGGRERENQFAYDIGVGIHKIEVSYGDSKQERWVVTMPAWLVIALVLVVTIVVAELLLMKRRRRIKRRTHPTPDK